MISASDDTLLFRARRTSGTSQRSGCNTAAASHTTNDIHGSWRDASRDRA